MLNIFSCVSQPFVCLLWRNVCLGLLTIFDWVVWFFVMTWLSSLYILEIYPLSVALFAIIFSHSEGCLLILFIVLRAQPWLFIGMTDAEAKAPILWPPDVKNWLIWKDSDSGKDWGLEKKGMTEDKMVGWHHWLDRHEFDLAPGVGDGQGGLACCSLWCHKESDMTEQLKWTELMVSYAVQNLLNLIRTLLFIFGFISITLDGGS